MAVRVFICPNCSHQVRLGAMHCGQCGARTPLLNWVSTQVVLLLFVVTLFLLGIALITR